MKLHIAGTGHATVKNNYNTCFVVENNNQYLLVDAGGGKQILKNLESLNIDVNKISYGFISHNHTDHLLGYIWIMRVVFYGYIKNKRTDDFHLYGSNECLNAVETIFKITCGEKLWNKFINNKVFMHEIKDNSTAQIIGLNIKFFDTLADDMPQMAFVVNNNEFVFCGDVPINEKYYNELLNAKYLWLEVFCLEKDRGNNIAPLKKHKTLEEACEIANKLNPQTLILSHTDDDTDGTRKDRFIKVAKTIYKGNIFIPNDLEVIELN